MKSTRTRLGIFLLLVSATHISCRLLPADRPPRDEDERREIQTGTQDRQARQVTTLKVLDFSADRDHLPDSNGEYTSATLKAGPLPESFTICSALMTEGWMTEFGSAEMFTLLEADGNLWGNINLFANINRFNKGSTDFEVRLGPVNLQTKVENLFFPLQWTRACLSVDSVAGKVMLVVDGELLGEKEYRREEDKYRPANISLLLGFYPSKPAEFTGQVSELNVFSSALPRERMIHLTSAGGEECGTPGDLISWEESEWTLHSQAKAIEVDREWEGPCRRESAIQVFKAEDMHHRDCMRHCQKISNGRSPPVTTREEWESFSQEIALISPDRSVFGYMWLSATEGDIDRKLAELRHWPETELVNNKTKKLEAVETIWRDYYSGQRLANWSKPYLKVWKDTRYDDSYNCMQFFTHKPWEKSWYEWSCKSYHTSCPCSYPAQPILRLRGLCEKSLMENEYTLKQLPFNPGNMIILGGKTARIEYNDTSSQWIMTDAWYGVRAVSRAPKLSYLLGKHKWTISNDYFDCNEAQQYTTVLKLTGCNPEGDFTCDDGQCIPMERRCDQVTNCRDESDEKGCKVIILKDGYNKNIPPTGKTKDERVVPADVSISITLMKVVEIEETDHSIHLQFQISMRWNESRVTYHNLKNQTSLNALTDDDVQKIWLPIIVYDNTDQKEVTRLGEYGNGEWATSVTVTREGRFTRSDIGEVNEAEIFEGAENSLTMNQTYTWEFQCKYKLQRYPFDTQVLNQVTTRCNRAI